MSTVIATPADPSANSYLTRDEADTYFTTRLFSATWTASDPATKDAAIIQATRLMDALLSPYTYLVPASGGMVAYYRTRPQWTGTPTTTTQALAWPRTGMFNRNGFAIDPMAIPQALKDATAELAGQLVRTDRLLDNDVSVQGITSIRAGSVALTFKSTDIEVSKVFTDAIWDLLVPSWTTDELITYPQNAEFDVV